MWTIILLFHHQLNNWSWFHVWSLHLEAVPVNLQHANLKVQSIHKPQTYFLFKTVLTVLVEFNRLSFLYRKTRITIWLVTFALDCFGIFMQPVSHGTVTVTVMCLSINTFMSYTEKLSIYCLLWLVSWLTLSYAPQQQPVYLLLQLVPLWLDQTLQLNSLRKGSRFLTWWGIGVCSAVISGKSTQYKDYNNINVTLWITLAIIANHSLPASYLHPGVWNFPPGFIKALCLPIKYNIIYLLIMCYIINLNP